MTAPLTPEAWDGEAAALIVVLAGIEEPVTWRTHGGSRYCVLCDSESRTPHGPIGHDSACVWERARWLMDEARR